MSTLIAKFSTRNATIAAAIAIALACWITNFVVRIVWDGMPFARALWPPADMLIHQSLMAAIMAFVAATAVYTYSRALHREVRSLDQCDLQHRMVLHSAFDSILTLDVAGKIVSANAAATRTFGAPESALVGMEIDRLIARVVEPKLRNVPIRETLLQPQNLWQHGIVQIVATRVDEQEFPAELNVVPLNYGQPGHRFVLIREVTERVAAKEALKKSEAKYRDLFESMIDGVYRCHADGTIIAANQTMVRMLGYESEAELRAKANAVRLCVNHEQSQAIMDALAENGEAREMVVDIQRKDGSTITVITNTQLISGDDATPIYQGTFSDITELRAATEALRDSEEHFRALTENAVDIIFVINEDLDLLYCSPSAEWITGFSADELLGRNVLASIHRDDLDVARNAVIDILTSEGQLKTFDCRFLRADKEIVRIETTGNAFRNSRGEIRAVLNSRDITQRRRTELQLQQAQKMQAIGHLTGGIAHDFNNLLTVIVGNLQLIGENELNAETDDQVNMAYRAAMQGADLTRRLLAFARRQPLDPEVINVGKLVQSMSPLLHRSLGKLMSIRLDLADDLWLAKVDPAQLESAILNLAINSRDAMDGEGLLTIRTRNCAYGASGLREDPVLIAGDYVCISVQDNGSGMSEDVRKAAIEPFFSTKEDRNGSGLGLSMVYGFVQQSGGHIRLDSEEGKGTRIDLYLPRSIELEMHNGAANGAEVTARGSETLLVVDDNPDVRTAAAAILVSLGYQTVEASSGAQALEVLQDRPVDLLFSDIKMPEMSGLDLAEHVRKRSPGTRILLTSGYSDEAPCGDKARSFEFLRKPYTRQDLSVRLRTILDN